MAANLSTIKVIDQSQVAPTSGSVSTTTIPLTFFDIPWFLCPPIQWIWFYELPYPTLHFTQTVLPRLKESLSLTLRHFFPFAAKITCPPPPHHPYIVYNEGDAIQVTVSESEVLFNHFVGNRARDIKILQSFFPKLPVAHLSSNDDTQVVPTMAIQFTVFPNSGISIGLTFNHVVTDGRSLQHFMNSWAFIHRSHEEDFTSLSLPYYKRDVIKDTQGFTSIIVKDLRNGGKDLDVVGEVSTPNNVLITFMIKRAKTEQLKHSITTQSKLVDELRQVHMSTYVVTCAFMWVNLMKLQEQIRGSSDDDDRLYYFVFVADCRERFELCIPGAYFGNCLTYGYVSAKKRDLMGEDGIAVASIAIGRKIFELRKGGALIGAEKWVSNYKQVVKDGRFVTVAGSPKFREYEIDFGWGKPKKSDLVQLAPYSCFSLTGSREDNEGIDIGIIIEQHKFDLFNALFE
ncbi:hypothetical protein Ddye_018463 [Dipteronia dyeriana]|uniref:Anthocyanin acyltransferase n=1 Tax=Dipteronia dyeriana TaxID=168575 RepID=A0AAD9UBF4_9ROSI|nr:hypothetical protein Ddye_018463 [Dipteronia dyeriana]